MQRLPAFQPLQISVRCVGESLDRFPSLIDTIRMYKVS
jgi:hypothetical protein